MSQACLSCLNLRLAVVCLKEVQGIEPKNRSKKKHPLGEPVSKRSWASQYRNEVGRASIKRGLSEPLFKGALSLLVLVQHRACSAHLRTDACSASPTGACSAPRLFSAFTYCCTPTVPARHSYSACSALLQCPLGTPKKKPAPSARPRSRASSPGWFRPDTLGSLTGKKLPGGRAHFHVFFGG